MKHLWQARATLSTPTTRIWILCLPSRASPSQVAITAPDAKTLGDALWAALNKDNKVSLFVRYIDLATGKTDTKIYNKHLEG